MTTLFPKCKYFDGEGCTYNGDCPIDGAQAWCFYAAAEEMEYIEENW